MTFTPAAKGGGSIGPREVEIYHGIFQEQLDKLIPSLLKPIYDERQFVFVPLPDQKCATVLEMYGGTSTEDGVNHFPIYEFADYVVLKDLTPATVIEKVKELAIIAAESYAWNVRNAFILNGRLRGWSQKLYCTDWKDEFFVNVVERGTGMCLEASDDLGWAAFRYRFAAGKI
jgi:hypothetical protein